MGKLEPVTVESESTLPKGFLGILTIVVMVCGPSMVGMMLTILIPVLPEIVKHVPGGRTWLIAMPTAGIVVGGVMAGFLLSRVSARNLMLVAIALFGLTQGMALFVIAFGAIWPTLLATVHGFAAVEPRLYEVARALHMSRLAVIFKIALPSASPDILSGMRLSLTVALILSVVCEMLAGLDGLGHWVLLSARAFRSADLFAGVILLGVVGYATALMMSAVERRLLVWRSSGH